MNKKQVFVVFEPINHMYWVAEAALDMGYDLLFISTLPINTVQPFSIEPEKVYKMITVTSWQDNEAVLTAIEEVITEYKIIGTYAAFESTLVYEAQLRTKVGLPSNSPEILKKALNKKYVRRTIRKYGLTELACFDKSECEALKYWPFEGAGYFKPVNGAGSAMVTRCENIAQLKQAIAEIDDKSAQVYVPFLAQYIEETDDFILEQAAEGELLSLESIVVDGELLPLGLTGRTRLKANPAVEMGAIYPYQNPYFDQIVEKARAIHQVLNINHGPTHTEFMVTEDGIIELVEINLRLIGSDAIEGINQSHGIKFQNLIAKIAMGKKIDSSDLALKTNCFSSLQLIIPPSGVTHYDELIFPDKVTYARYARKKGDKLSGNSYQLDQIASFIVTASTQDEVIELANKIRMNTIFNGKKLGDDLNNLTDKFEYNQ